MTGITMQYIEFVKVFAKHNLRKIKKRRCNRESLVNEMKRKNTAINVLNNKNLLIVDDDSSTLMLLQKLLSRQFKSVITADNGAKGVKAFENNTLDCILTDVTMPESDGIELATQVREMNKEIVIIFMTGHNESAFIEKFRELGCYSVTKPVVLEDLMKIFMESFQ